MSDGSGFNAIYQRSKNVDTTAMRSFAEFASGQVTNKLPVTYGNFLNACAVFLVEPLVFALACKRAEIFGALAYDNIKASPRADQLALWRQLCQQPDSDDEFVRWWAKQVENELCDVMKGLQDGTE